MDSQIRRGRPDDLEVIASWTQDTFEWGDYVAERYLDWLTDANSEVLVCDDHSHQVVALVHATLASPTEGWMEGARVHPDFKRSGMGSALNQAGVELLKTRGAKVVRLAVETDNPVAMTQVSAIGYRAGSTWVTGFKQPDLLFQSPKGSRLQTSVAAEVDSAWMFWSTSELAGVGRGMLCEGWLWRRATPGDLKDAATDKRLLQNQHGWVMIRPGTDDLQTMWLAAAPADLPGLLDGVLDHASQTAAHHLVVKIPALDWSKEALKRAGFDVKEIVVYYKPV